MSLQFCCRWCISFFSIDFSQSNNDFWWKTKLADWSISKFWILEFISSILLCLMTFWLYNKIVTLRIMVSQNLFHKLGFGWNRYCFSCPFVKLWIIFYFHEFARPHHYNYSNILLFILKILNSLILAYLFYWLRLQSPNLLFSFKIYEIDFNLLRLNIWNYKWNIKLNSWCLGS